MKKYFFSLLSIVLLIASVMFLSSAHQPEKTETAFAKGTDAMPNPYYNIETPAYIDFAGEVTPLHIPDVKERLERELLVTAFRHSNTFLMLKRQTRWFPVIERILLEEGVPVDFKYLCVAESGLANATSPAGAKGFWQFLKSTGKSYGLEINDMVDERYHIEKSTRAACQYLKEARKRFGSWTAAAASYNMGMSGFSRQIERQGQTDYYDLLLNPETSRYIFRVLAFKAVLSQPILYGFIIDDNDTYKPYVCKNVIIDSDVTHFADFAKRYNINYKELKILNPWLRDNFLKVPEGKSYMVKILL